MPVLRIATRQSPLALWQAGFVRTRLQNEHPDLEVQLLPLSTSGDAWTGTALPAAGVKGLFVKELEEALLDGRADVAVHSMKDVPGELPPGLCLGAFLAGEDPRDAFVSYRHAALAALPPGGRVGTSSLRRQAQLRAERPDLAVADLRGNVGTRLARLDEGRFDALLLACAGLTRLGLASRIREPLEVERFVPAVGQGVIGVECRCDDARTRERVAAVGHDSTALRIAAERALSARLGGSCRVPVAGHAVIGGARGAARTLRLTGLVAAPDGGRVLKDHVEGPAERAADLGAALAERLLAAGGAEVLRAVGVDV